MLKENMIINVMPFVLPFNINNQEWSAFFLIKLGLKIIVLVMLIGALLEVFVITCIYM